MNKIPAAITAPGLVHTEAITLAAEWLVHHLPGEKRTIYVPSKGFCDEQPIVYELRDSYGFEIKVLGKHLDLHRGAILAVDVIPEDIFRVPHQKINGIAITSQYCTRIGNTFAYLSGLQAWASGMQAVPLGTDEIQWAESNGVDNAVEAQEIKAVPPAIEKILNQLAGRLNPANSFNSPYEANHIKSCLKAIYRETKNIDLKSLEAWAWSKPWTGPQVKELLALAKKINGGGTVRLTSGGPRFACDYSDLLKGTNW